jgi:hypothetical protein
MMGSLRLRVIIPAAQDSMTLFSNGAEWQQRAMP